MEISVCSRYLEAMMCSGSKRWGLKGQGYHGLAVLLMGLLLQLAK